MTNLIFGRVGCEGGSQSVVISHTLTKNGNRCSPLLEYEITNRLQVWALHQLLQGHVLQEV